MNSFKTWQISFLHQKLISKLLKKNKKNEFLKKIILKKDLVNLNEMKIKFSKWLFYYKFTRLNKRMFFIIRNNLESSATKYHRFMLAWQIWVTNMKGLYNKETYLRKDIKISLKLISIYIIKKLKKEFFNKLYNYYSPIYKNRILKAYLIKAYLKGYLRKLNYKCDRLYNNNYYICTQVLSQVIRNTLIIIAKKRQFKMILKTVRSRKRFNEQIEKFILFKHFNKWNKICFRLKFANIYLKKRIEKIVKYYQRANLSNCLKIWLINLRAILLLSKVKLAKKVYLTFIIRSQSFFCDLRNYTSIYYNRYVMKMLFIKIIINKWMIKWRNVIKYEKTERFLIRLKRYLFFKLFAWFNYIRDNPIKRKIQLPFYLKKINIHIKIFRPENISRCFKYWFNKTVKIILQKIHEEKENINSLKVVTNKKKAQIIISKLAKLKQKQINDFLISYKLKLWAKVSFYIKFTSKEKTNALKRLVNNNHKEIQSKNFKMMQNQCLFSKVKSLSNFNIYKNLSIKLDKIFSFKIKSKFFGNLFNLFKKVEVLNNVVDLLLKLFKQNHIKGFIFGLQVIRKSKKIAEIISNEKAINNQKIYFISNYFIRWKKILYGIMNEYKTFLTKGKLHFKLIGRIKLRFNITSIKARFLKWKVMSSNMKKNIITALFQRKINKVIKAHVFRLGHEMILNFSRTKQILKLKNSFLDKIVKLYNSQAGSNLRQKLNLWSSINFNTSKYEKFIKRVTNLVQKRLLNEIKEHVKIILAKKTQRTAIRKRVFTKLSKDEISVKAEVKRLFYFWFRININNKIQSISKSTCLKSLFKTKKIATGNIIRNYLKQWRNQAFCSALLRKNLNKKHCEFLFRALSSSIIRRLKEYAYTLIFNTSATPYKVRIIQTILRKLLLQNWLKLLMYRLNEFLILKKKKKIMRRRVEYIYNQKSEKLCQDVLKLYVLWKRKTIQLKMIERSSSQTLRGVFKSSQVRLHKSLFSILNKWRRNYYGLLIMKQVEIDRNMKNMVMVIQRAIIQIKRLCIRSFLSYISLKSKAKEQSIQAINYEKNIKLKLLVLNLSREDVLNKKIKLIIWKSRIITEGNYIKLHRDFLSVIIFKIIKKYVITYFNSLKNQYKYITKNLKQKKLKKLISNKIDRNFKILKSSFLGYLLNSKKQSSSLRNTNVPSSSIFNKEIDFSEDFDDFSIDLQELIKKDERIDLKKKRVQNQEQEESRNKTIETLNTSVLDKTEIDKSKLSNHGFNSLKINNTINLSIMFNKKIAKDTSRHELKDILKDKTRSSETKVIENNIQFIINEESKELCLIGVDKLSTKDINLAQIQLFNNDKFEIINKRDYCHQLTKNHDFELIKERKPDNSISNFNDFILVNPINEIKDNYEKDTISNDYPVRVKEIVEENEIYRYSKSLITDCLEKVLCQVDETILNQLITMAITNEVFEFLGSKTINENALNKVIQEICSIEILGNLNEGHTQEKNLIAHYYGFELLTAKTNNNLDSTNRELMIFENEKIDIINNSTFNDKNYLLENINKQSSKLQIELKIERIEEFEIINLKPNKIYAKKIDKAVLKNKYVQKIILIYQKKLENETINWFILWKNIANTFIYKKEVKVNDKEVNVFRSAYKSKTSNSLLRKLCFKKFEKDETILKLYFTKLLNNTFQSLYHDYADTIKRFFINNVRKIVYVDEDEFDQIAKPRNENLFTESFSKELNIKKTDNYGDHKKKNHLNDILSDENFSFHLKDDELNMHNLSLSIIDHQVDKDDDFMNQIAKVDSNRREITLSKLIYSRIQNDCNRPRVYIRRWLKIMLESEETILLPDDSKDNKKSIFVDNKFDFHSLLRNVNDSKTYYYLIENTNIISNQNTSELKDLFDLHHQKSNIYEVNVKDCQDLIKKIYAKNVNFLFKLKKITTIIRRAIFSHIFKEIINISMLKVGKALELIRIKNYINSYKAIVKIQRNLRGYLSLIKQRKIFAMMYNLYLSQAESNIHSLRSCLFQWKKFSLNKSITKASNIFKKFLARKLFYLKIKRRYMASSTLNRLLSSFIAFKVIKPFFKEFVITITLSRAEYFLTSFIEKVCIRNLIYFSQIKKFVGNNYRKLLMSNIDSCIVLQNRVAYEIRQNTVRLKLYFRLLI